MRLLILLFTLFTFSNLFSKTWEIGISKTYKYCSEIVSLVNDGDTVLIDDGIYENDKQVTWTKNNLYIKGKNKRPKLVAGSKIANDATNGKGIFVTTGKNIKIENIEFANSTVISRNGAGIRQEGANLYIKYCKFTSNEMGVLSGNIPNCKTIIEYSEFVNGGSTFNPGYQHNIYINHIDTFIFRYNFTYDAIAQGHELKSRASYNMIMYNNISNIETIDSRNIDLPNGGTAIIIGNIIVQSNNSANSNIIGYGLEGLTNNAAHCLYICNNTIVNKKSTGSFIHTQVGTDSIFAKNNIFTGEKTAGLFLGNYNVLDTSHNLIINKIADIGFENINTNNYKLTKNSIAIDQGIFINRSIVGYELQAKYEYNDTCKMVLKQINNKMDIGAYEYLANLTQQHVFKDQITVYPNPTQSLINIKTSFNNVQIEVYNLNGQMMLFSDSKSINLVNFENGIYTLKIKTDKSVIIKKLIKY